MTKDEVYEYYLHWRKGSRTLSVEELFSAYTIDQNIFESSSKVINRLFYLVPDFFKSNLRIFIFYEENTFLKDYDKLDIENPIIRINTAFKGCSSLEKISVLPRIYHN